MTARLLGRARAQDPSADWPERLTPTTEFLVFQLESGGRAGVAVFDWPAYLGRAHERGWQLASFPAIHDQVARAWAEQIGEVPADLGQRAAWNLNARNQYQITEPVKVSPGETPVPVATHDEVVATRPVGLHGDRRDEVLFRDGHQYLRTDVVDRRMAELKAQVYRIAMHHAHENDWCGVVQTALREMGIEPVPEYFNIEAEIKIVLQVRDVNDAAEATRRAQEIINQHLYTHPFPRQVGVAQAALSTPTPHGDDHSEHDPD